MTLRAATRCAHKAARWQHQTSWQIKINGKRNGGA